MSGMLAGASLLATIFGDVDRLDCKYLVEHGRITKLGERSGEWWTNVVLDCYPDASHPAFGYEVETLIRDCGGDPMELLEQMAKAASNQPSSVLAAARFPLSLFGRGEDAAPEVLDGVPLADSHLHSGGSMPLNVFLSGLATCPSPLGVKARRSRTDLDAVEPLGTEEPRRERIPLVSGSGLEWDATVLLAAVRWSLRLLWFCERTAGLTDRAQLAGHLLEADLVDLVLEGKFWAEVKKAATSQKHSELADKLNCSFYDEVVVPGDLRGLLGNWQRLQSPTQRRRWQFALGLIRAVVAISGMATSLPGEGLGRFANRFRLMGRVQKAVFGIRSDDSVSKWQQRFLVGTIEEIAPTRQVVAAEFRRTFKATTRGKFETEVLRELAIHHAAFAEFCHDSHPMALTMPVGFGRSRSSDSELPGGLDELTHVVAGCAALNSISLRDHGAELIEAIWSIDVAGSEIGSSNWPFHVGAQLLAKNEVDLLFTIHAGESFTSELNGIRRVGELFLGSVHPDRIGHALSLSEDAAKAVLSRGRPPISRVEAIMDLAWLHIALQSREALMVLEALTPRELPLPNIEAEVWVEAFEALHDLDSLEGILIATAGDQREVARRSSVLDDVQITTSLRHRAIAALAAGAPPASVGCDVMAELSQGELELYETVAAEESARARKHVLDRVREGGVTIESCPSSNITLAGLSDYSTHPLWKWSKGAARVDLSVSSDDPLHFGHNVLGELSALIATGKDPKAVRKAIETGMRECSGGNRNGDNPRLQYAPQGYQRVVDMVAAGR